MSNSSLKNPAHIKSMFFDAYFRATGLQQLVSAVSELMNNPLIVFDMGFRILAFSDIQYITDPNWKEFVEQGYCSYDYVEYLLNDETVRETKKQRGAFQIHCTELKNTKIGCKILLNGQQVGTVILLDCQNALQECDLALMEMVAFMVGDMLQKSNMPLSIVRTEDLLYNLLEKRISSEEELSLQLRIMQARLPKTLRLIVFDFSQHMQNKDGRLNVIRDHLGLTFSLVYQDHLIALYDASKHDRIAPLIEETCSTYGLYAGISQTFQDILTIREQYTRALGNLRTGKRAYSLKRVFYTYHAAIFSMLPELSAEKAYESFCHPTLKNLREYDLQHGTDLFSTLFVYLMCGNNVQQTAQALFLHRNSVRNRITKITEYTNIDLTNTIEMSDLVVSYRILKYYSADQFLPNINEEGRAAFAGEK